VDPATTAEKIKSMEIRGALFIATSAVESLIEFIEGYEGDDLLEELKREGEILKKARPTAVSLPNAVNYCIYLANAEKNRGELLKKLRKFVKEQKESLEKIARIGAKRIEKNDCILTHCNSQTAIDIIIEAHKQGKDITSICTETRPRHQGYITARQLADAGVPVTLVIDSAVRFAIREEEVDKVVVGADTVCANGALINKIGTSQVALIAKEFNVPVICGCETIKFSPETLLGNLVEIEDRNHKEIREPMEGVRMLNPAFDVTPPEYIDVIVTEDGIIPPHASYDVLKDKFGWEMEMLKK